MASVIQPSFAAGEMAPALYGRVDTQRYAIGLKTCRNFIVQQSGGVMNRPGTQFIATTKTTGRRVRLIQFAFSTTQTYILEFGHLYLRVFKDGGQVEASPGVPYEIVTPYEEDDLPDLRTVQSADVMTICHPDFAPRQLARTGHTAWTLSLLDYKNGPFQDQNFDTTKTVYASAATGTATLTASASIFTAAHVGMLIEIVQKDYGQPWEAGKSVTANDIRRSDGKYYRAVNTATTGSLRPTHDADTWSDGVVNWEFLHPGFGVAKITGYTSGTVVTATVVSRLPDAAVGSGGATYKWSFGAWGGNQGWPTCSTYFQERQVFAGTPAKPQTAWLSRSGNYSDFGRSTPSADDDAITLTVASREVNAIQHMLSMDNNLVLLTTGAEWIVSGADGVLAPATVQAKVQGYRGIGRMPPLVIGNSILYVQDKGATVRDMGYDFASDSYTGTDLTIFASHFTGRYRVVEWAFQQTPFMTSWIVRDDGALLGLTYLKEQQLVGWHRHDTDGQFESIACVSEGDEDALYAVVNRNGMRCVERFASRRIFDVREAFFVDSGLSYDGRNVSAKTLTISGGTAWNQDESLAVTASGATFAAGDVGAEIHMPIDGGVLRLAVEGYTSSTQVTVRPNRAVPAGLRGVATASWSIARKVFSGLAHMEGKTVSVLADGNVHPQLVVDGGGIELQYAASIVHAGLPIESDLETLELSSTQETIRDKKKLVRAVNVLVEGSRNIWAGPSAERLIEYKQRAGEGYDDPVALLTGMMDMRIKADWNSGGQVFIRQSDPLPLHVLAIIPEVILGD